MFYPRIKAKDVGDGEGTDPIVTREYILNNPLMEDGTFLYMATKLNQGDVVRTLLSCGADPGIQNTQGFNAIDVATSEHMRQIYVDELLRATANSELDALDCLATDAGVTVLSPSIGTESSYSLLASSREAETTTRCDDELDFTEIVGFVTCLYGDFWWLACVLDSFEDKQEFKVSFLHPHGPAPSNFTYPTVPDILRVHRSSILTTVDPLTATGRVYTLTKAETENATRKLFAVKQMVGRVCQLVAAGININSWDSVESKNTPLHWAACYGNKEIVTCLISRGADVNSMNACGATPLHDAVIGTDDGVVQELLQAGANPLIQANKG
uniref:(California timema) hypothetical protein n=1 Tax=Timema californicum TaxID=61474 RepID=A0A7R9P667_TIMCA|nr:unnamed protein product [Timema californicum]